MPVQRTNVFWNLNSMNVLRVLDYSENHCSKNQELIKIQTIKLTILQTLELDIKIERNRRRDYKNSECLKRLSGDVRMKPIFADAVNIEHSPILVRYITSYRISIKILSPINIHKV